MANYWPSRVSVFTPDSTNNYKELNKPLVDLAARTDYLKTELESASRGEYLSICDQRLAPESQIGQMMAWSTQRNLFAPARAGWEGGANMDGTLRPGDVAVPTGVLICKQTDVVGEIATSGALSAFGNMVVLFGTPTPAAGLYYLSGSVPGRLSPDPAANPVMAAQLTTDGTVFLIAGKAPEATHEHVSVSLSPDNWLAANTGNFPSAAIPPGALFGYDMTRDPAASALCSLFLVGAFLTDSVTGANIPPASFVVNEYGLWWLSAAPANRMEVWLVRPSLSGGGLRSVVSTTPDDMSAHVSGGIAYIGLTGGADEFDVGGASVVKGMVGRSLKIGNVVESVSPGTGISVTSSLPDGKGSVVISAAAYTSYLIDAMGTSLQGECIPTGSAAVLNLSATAPKWGTGFKKLKFWLWVRGAPNGIFPIETVKIECSLLYPPCRAGTDLPPGEIVGGVWRPREAMPDGTYNSLASVLFIQGFSPCLNNKMYLMESTEANWLDIGPECVIKYSMTFGGVRLIYVHRAGVTIMEV